MSTYNGEKYIIEQLDSILQQSLPVDILIRDDGSSDGTIAIIEDYIANGAPIELIRGENVGVIASFFALIKAAPESDFYAFSDQDDCWYPEKLEAAVTKIQNQEEMENAKEGPRVQFPLPLLYCGDTYLTDGELNPIKVDAKNPRPSFGNALVENICTGCTAVVNRALLEKIRECTPDTNKIVMHDWWLYLIAETYGKTIYDNEPHMYYRQHGNNEWGAKTSKWKVYKYRFKQLFAKRGQIYRQLEEFERCCGENGMALEQAEQVKEILNGEKSLLARIRLFRDKKIYRNNGRDLVYRLAMMAGKL